MAPRVHLSGTESARKLLLQNEMLTPFVSTL